MPEDTTKQYRQMEPLLKRDFLRLSQKQSNHQQYHSIANTNHRHNGNDTPTVIFSTLRNVQNYAVINTIVLTPAQILALHTTPVILVKAPTNAKTVTIVDNITARIVYSGAAYTGGNNLEFRYTNGSGTKVTADIPSTFINSTVNAFAHAPAVTAEFAPITGGSGANGQVVVSVPTANPAAGNSSITLVVHYHIVSFVN